MEMAEHVVYTANRVKGLKLIPFGKCLCGAYLKDQQEIDEHRKLEPEWTANRRKIFREEPEDA